MKTTYGWLALVLVTPVLLACGDDGGAGSEDGGSSGHGGSHPDGGGTGGGGEGGSGSGGEGGTGATGTGGSDAPVDAGGPGMVVIPNPCTLLSAEEWAPLMEATPTVEENGGMAGPVTVTRCSWTHEDQTRRQWGNLNLAVAGAYSAIPMSMPIDIGDEGYVSALDIARTIDLGWRKGELSATFKYSALVVPPATSWPDLRDAAIELARLAASRMP